jgi:WXXGXW repeat (2 copies)
MRTIIGRAAAAVLLCVGLFTAAPAQAATRIYVRIGPPPIVVEHHSRLHWPGRTWRPGYYRWDGRRYEWTRGAYVRAPYRHAVYVSGRWTHERHGWYWVPGHWVRR